MENKKYLISICIPSYNRPETLLRLLRSVDTKYLDKVQIVICEDKAPKRLEVRTSVETFKSETKYVVKYCENEQNLGHGKNFRECIKQAEGEYVTYMGDDDVFEPCKLDGFIEWLDQNHQLGYVLRAWVSSHGEFKYYDGLKYFEPAVETYEAFFLKSVFMSGFTIKRDYAYELPAVEELDDTLLYQLYMMAEVVKKYPSAYYPEIFVRDVGDGISFFGKSDSEAGKYEVGKLVSNNLNFIKGYLKITSYIDKKYGLDTTSRVKLQMSKYSYPMMSFTRPYGKEEFKKHCDELKSLGLNESKYFSIYYYALLWFGTPFCNGVIRFIKRIIGRRPNL